MIIDQISDSINRKVVAQQSGYFGRVLSLEVYLTQALDFVPPTLSKASGPGDLHVTLQIIVSSSLSTRSQSEII